MQFLFNGNRCIVLVWIGALFLATEFDKCRDGNVVRIGNQALDALRFGHERLSMRWNQGDERYTETDDPFQPGDSHIFFPQAEFFARH